MNWVPPQKWEPAKLQAAKELARRKLSVRHYLNPKQQEFYSLWDDGIHRELGLFCSRKSGKSFISLLICYEYCWRNPGHIVRYVSPTLKTSREVTLPIASEFKNLLPDELLPTVRKAELKLIFPNGAEIHLGGASIDNCEGNRGPIAHLLVVEESAAWPDGEDYDYVTKSILFPQLTTTEGRILYLTTPPRSPAHKWMTDVYPKLKDSKALVEFTIYDNPLLTEDMVRDIEALYGGRDSKDFKREYLLHLVPDTSRAVCPEYDDDEHLVDGEAVLAEWVEKDKTVLFPYIVTDYGATDDTGTVLVVYNYAEQKCLAVEESTVKNGNIKEFVDEYWKHHKNAVDIVMPGVEPASIIDCMEQTRRVLRDVYEMEFKRPLKKRHKADSVTYMREKFASGQIMISKTCIRLRNMLKLGMWKDSKAELKEFERSETLSHLDHLDALIYAVLYIPWGRIPNDGANKNMRLR